MNGTLLASNVNDTDDSIHMRYEFLSIVTVQKFLWSDKLSRFVVKLGSRRLWLSIVVFWPPSLSI